MFPFLIYILTLVCIYAIIVMSLNLAMGYTGLVNFGHIGLFGIGAYTSAILTTKFDWPFVFAILSAGILCAIIGALLSIPSRKIKDDYFALLTLGFLFVTGAIFINWTDMTRGTLGIRGILRPEGFTEPNSFLILTFIAALVTFFILEKVTKSPFGRVLEAIRDDELVAESLGKNIDRAKMTAMTLSGFFVGIAGVLMAHFIRFINPASFWLDPLVVALAAVVIGGLASLRGSILGVVIVFAVSESLRFLSLPSTMIGPMRVILFMIVLLVVILFRPKGIIGRADLD
ncbi:branched-chain amino acid ABC transporter permease [Candidatus Uhrbacteria bacterium]|nr:branched-chain amino acid ABC transporter permease [Candidatus Uhrbacteria bacterium]